MFSKKDYLTKAFFILAFLTIILDGGFALWGQSKYYWQDYASWYLPLVYMLILGTISGFIIHKMANGLPEQ